MSFKNKIILVTVILFIAALDMSFIYLVNKSSDFLYNNEYTSAQNEQQFIIQNINGILKGSVNKNVSKQKMCEDIVSAYNVFYKQYNVNLKLVESDKAKKSNNAKNIVITEELDSPYSEFTLLYEKNTDSLYNMQLEWRHIFFIINIVFVLGIALIGSAVITRLFKPLDVILKSIRNVRNGNYTERINIKSNDEFGEIALEYNNMADAVQNAVIKLQNTATEKELLAENMAHELRNPLTSIKGFSEYLLKGNSSDENRMTALKYIYDETTRLQKLCNKMLDISLQNHSGITIDSVDINNLIDEIKRAEYVKFNDKGVELEVEADISTLKADKSLLISLITNLLDNSVNASEKGQKVNLKFYNEGENTVISVVDNGKGMEEEYVNKIFEPFYRIDKSRSRENGGAGLGLALCMNIVNLHNGKIEVNSKHNEGTEFKVFLPTIYNGFITF
jgi:signal transduction histidine kinase